MWASERLNSSPSLLFVFFDCNLKRQYQGSFRTKERPSDLLCLSQGDRIIYNFYRAAYDLADSSLEIISR